MKDLNSAHSSEWPFAIIYLLSDSKWSTIPEFQHSLDAALLNACVLFKQSIFQPNLTIYGIP